MPLSRRSRSAIPRDSTRRLAPVSSKVRSSSSDVRDTRPLTSFACITTDFTGISAPYEAPENPELHIKTNEVDIPGGVKIIVDYLEKHKYI